MICTFIKDCIRQEILFRLPDKHCFFILCYHGALIMHSWVKIRCWFTRVYHRMQLVTLIIHNKMQSDDSWLYHLQSNPFYNRNTLFCTEQGTNENFIHISNHHIFDFDWDKMLLWLVEIFSFFNSLSFLLSLTPMVLERYFNFLMHKSSISNVHGCDSEGSGLGAIN